LLHAVIFFLPLCLAAPHLPVCSALPRPAKYRRQCDEGRDKLSDLRDKFVALTEKIESFEADKREAEERVRTHYLHQIDSLMAQIKQLKAKLAAAPASSSAAAPATAAGLASPSSTSTPAFAPPPFALGRGTRPSLTAAMGLPSFSAMQAAAAAAAAAGSGGGSVGPVAAVGIGGKPWMPPATLPNQIATNSVGAASKPPASAGGSTPQKPAAGASTSGNSSGVVPGAAAAAAANAHARSGSVLQGGQLFAPPGSTVLAKPGIHTTHLPLASIYLYH
jgi:hypothetical protein